MLYIPRRGDIVWLNFDPQAGHEQAGRRPAFVISPELYNQKTSLFLVCPITSRVKHYPFEVSLPLGLSVAGVVLADQIKNLDWKAGRAEFAEMTSPEFARSVVSLILPLVNEEGD